MRKVVFLILSLSPFIFIQGQWPDEKNFRLYTTKDGLSSNDIWSIAQDSYGYIWIGTKKGLNRFDGNSFQQFYADSSRNSLSQDFVYRLKVLNDEHLAVITVGGLHIINTRTLMGRNLLIPADTLKTIQKVNLVLDVLEDIKGNVFVITATGFYQFDKNDKLVFRYDPYSRAYIEEYGASFGQNIFRIDDNTLLLSAENGLSLYRIAERKLCPPGKNEERLLGPVSSVKQIDITGRDEKSFGESYPDKTGFSWYDLARKTKQEISLPFKPVSRLDITCKLVHINDSLAAINCTQKGFYLLRFDRSTNSYIFLPKPHFESYICSALLIDKNGYLWIPTERGLFKEKRSNGTVEMIQIKPISNAVAKNTSVHSIAIANNYVFAGTFDDGVYVLDADSLKTLKIIDFSNNGKSSNLVTDLIDIKDSLYTAPVHHWINTRNFTHGLVNLPDTSRRVVIVSIYKDSHQNLYLVTKKNLYFKGSEDKQWTIPAYRDFFGRNLPGYITEDPQGNIWFGGNGIARLNRQTQELDIKLDSFPFIKMPRKELSSNVAFDNNGRVYFGVVQNGLAVYDILNKKFTHFTRSDGLPDNDIKAIYFHNNRLWIGTENGLAAYDPSTGKISIFGIADGIPPEPLTLKSFAYDSIHHNLYAAFTNSIVRFDPDVLRKNNVPPAFFIENIVISQKEVLYHPQERVELNYRQNNIVVNLSAINFEDAYLQQFAYRFMGTGKEPWQDIGSQRSIILSSLSNGVHHLQVKAFINNNSWPEQVKEITIIVKPPFWKTTWFVVLISLLMLALLYWVYRYRIRAIQQKANIDKRLAELEIKGLHAQMNPHFIFNSLNSIKEMILEDEKQNASRYLSKFAQLIRTNLEQCGIL